PIGGLALVESGEISLHAIILRPDGSQFFEVRRRGRPAAAEAVGEAAAEALLAQAPKGFFDA
ncbi:MAG TPA: hydroxymethylbilane synthase, partial [Methylovirgula sp.]